MSSAPLQGSKAPPATPMPFKASTTCPACVFFNPIAWILIFLDFIIWLLTSFVGKGLVKTLMLTFSSSYRVVDVGKAKRLEATQTALRSTAWSDCETGIDCVLRAFEMYADQECLGTREYLGTYKKEGSKYSLKRFGATTWKTYSQVQERALAFGAGLINLGMVPLPPQEGQNGGTRYEETTDPHTLLIFENTCADWITAMIGAMTQSLACATSYSTLGISSVADAAEECNVKVIFCNYENVAKIAENAGRMPMLTHIVYSTNYVTAEEAATPPKVEGGGITVLSMDEVVELGRSQPVALRKPKPENMAVIMYTSGSTGKPKGVMIRQRNICASVAALLHYISSSGVMVAGQETYLAYLPAAHILELCAEFSMICFGARLGFCDPKTISSKGAVRQLDDGTIVTQAAEKYTADTTPPGGIQEFRPTCMAAVPKIWDILKKGVEDGLAKKSGLVRGLFQLAFSYRNFMVNHNMDTPLFNAILFVKRFKTLLGGRSKLFITGGGPISSEVQTFIRVAFATPLIQGYALTETTCAGTVQYPSDPRNLVVGPPVASVEIMLRNCTEPEKDEEGAETGGMVPSVLDRNDEPYLSTDTMHYGERVLGRGEVLIRGPSVSSGYLKQPEKTAQEFDSEGFFHSGDIAVFTTDGALKIVDRLKNLIKLKGGEYIAIESMEKEYGKSVFVNAVNGGIMCYGDGEMDRPVALVQADLVEIRKRMTGTGLENADPEELCRDEAAVNLVLEDLRKEGRNGGLAVNEMLQTVALISGDGPETEAAVNSPWTPENQLLTASNKLNRKPIQKALASVLEPLRQKAIR